MKKTSITQGLLWPLLKSAATLLPGLKKPEMKKLGLSAACILGMLTTASAQGYIGGYIRPDRLETGLISNALLQKNTDLMVLGFYPKATDIYNLPTMARHSQQAQPG